MNVLLITTDQQRADTLGVEGSPLGATPRLDALAAEGTRFAAARTQNPLCQPARATILTGTYPSTHGVTCNGIDLPADATERSVATLLGQAGYRTAMFGKAHFATTFPFQPTGKPESVEGSARVDESWHGPYFGFEHVELALFGHNLRIADLMGAGTGATDRRRSACTTRGTSSATDPSEATSASSRCSRKRTARCGTTGRRGATHSPRKTI